MNTRRKVVEWFEVRGWWQTSLVMLGAVAVLLMVGGPMVNVAFPQGGDDYCPGCGGANQECCGGNCIDTQYNCCCNGTVITLEECGQCPECEGE
jgi:hypothetical protein